MSKLPSDKNALKYHLMPPMGWLNDPNGLCRFNETVHIFFQHSEDPSGGLKQWGHYTTTDYLNYQLHQTALKPDIAADRDGVYSGSAFIADGKMHLYYTGNVKYNGEYDYINSGREANVIHVVSEDGFAFSPKTVVLTNDDYPEDLTCHVRDPKVFLKKGTYQMVLGARNKKDRGLVLVYQSEDLENWTFSHRLETETKLGYMWECPDYINLDNQEILICCPQGVAQAGDGFQPLYNNGYFVVHDDKLGEFIEMDIGFDFYAPQTFNDGNRTIMIGWMGMPDVDYINENANQWQHCLTIPRELVYEKGILKQRPLEELKRLRKREFEIESGTLEDNCYELIFENIESDFHLELRDDVIIDFENGKLSFKMGSSGRGRDSRILELDTLESLTVYSDTTSLEIFINDGVKSISTRIYDQSTTIKCNCRVKGYYLAGFTIADNHNNC